MCGSEDFEKDYKLVCKSLCKNRGKKLPKYEVLAEEGPRMIENFWFASMKEDVWAQGRVWCSKKNAEQSAAKNALEANVRRRIKMDTKQDF